MDSIFAVFLVALVLAGPVVAALTGWAPREELLPRSLCGIMACVLAIVLAPVFAGGPPTPNLFWVLGLGATAAILTVRKKWALGAICVAIGLVWLICAFAYPGFLGLGKDIGQRYRGDGGPLRSKQRSVLGTAQDLLKDLDLPKPISPGWMDESFPVRDVAEFAGKNPTILRAVEHRFHPIWHTWLTGLWRIEEVALEPWYPGGAIQEAVDKIELRPRIR